jgi:ABC-type lipoprotein release transport system permease subunit
MIVAMAWRNIWRNKMRSIVILLSIAIGLFAGIAVQALYKGMLKSRVRTVIDAEVGHLQWHDSSFKKDYDPRFVLANGKELLQSVSNYKGVRLAAPRSITNGMLATATGSAGVQINGVVPGKEYAASQLQKKIVEGRGFDSSKRNELLVGRKLAKKMKLKTGSKLVLTFTDTSGSIVSSAFRVAGIYQSDNAPLDERNVYVSITELNSLLGIGQSFHEIVILLQNDELLNQVQEGLRKIYPAYQLESWKDISPETELMVNTTNQYSYIIMIIIMIALAFGIINTMLMAILERSREIGMMVALGTSRLKVFLLVMLETVFLSLAGTPVGILLSWLVTAYFNKNGLDLSGMGREMMSSFGFSTTIYPEFPTDKLGAVLLIVIATAFLSCLFPAVKALKLSPVEALRR